MRVRSPHPVGKSCIEVSNKKTRRRNESGASFEESMSFGSVEESGPARFCDGVSMDAACFLASQSGFSRNRCFGESSRGRVDRTLVIRLGTHADQRVDDFPVSEQDDRRD